MPFKHRIAGVIAAMGAAVLLGSPVFAAGSGYNPGPPVPPGTPGGYSKIVVVKTIPLNKKTPTTLEIVVNGSHLYLQIPPHAFKTKVELVITKPNLNAVTKNLYKYRLNGYKAVAGLGVEIVNLSGHLYKGKFLKPVFVTIKNKKIGYGDIVIGWNQSGKFFRVSKPLIRKGKVIVKFETDPALAVVSPNKRGRPGSAVPGATSPVTGKPFVGEAAAGLALLAGGAALLYRTRRRRLS